MIRLALKALDPLRLMALHRTLQFRASAICGEGFRATGRATIFPHQALRDAISFGAHACIDGTVEVYDRGRLTIGDHFFLGRSRIYCAHRITIGNYVLISDNVAIMDSDLHPLKASARRTAAKQWSMGRFPDVYDGGVGGGITIEDDVWIGFGACLLKGITIGQGAVIGAGAVVTADVQPWQIVAGSPARVIRELTEDER